jgi:hypothetical protein
MSRNAEHDHLSRLIEQHYDAPAPGGSFVDSLRRRLGQELARTAQVPVGTGDDRAGLDQAVRKPIAVGRRRWRWVAAPIGLAACLLIGVMLRPAVPSHAETLHEQVLAAIDQARSVHVTVKRLQDGQLREDGELWYQQGRRLVEVRYRQGRSHVRIDDGRSQGHYVFGDLFKSAGVEPVRTIAEFLDAKWLGFDLSRLPPGDRYVDGVRCRMYTLFGGDYTLQIRFWIDQDMRPRKFEIRRFGPDGWQPTQQARVRYDLPMDGFEFFADLGPKLAILQADTPLSERFSLDNALFTKQMPRAVVAIHELRQCENGLIFLAYSVRPDPLSGSADTWLGKTGGPSPTDQFKLVGRWQSSPGAGLTSYPYQYWPLAEMLERQTQIFWCVLKPEDFWRDSLDGRQSGGFVHLQAELQTAGPYARSRRDEQLRPLATLPVPSERIPLAYIVARLYCDRTF